MSDVFLLSTREEYQEYLEQIWNGNSKIEETYTSLIKNSANINKVMRDENLSEREFIEIIASCRQINYNESIGGANKAAENETDRLYAKNAWKFVEEFLQNADDCNYSSEPQIDITIDERDERHPSIEFCYNEDGFSREDIWAITAFSESTKVNDTVEKQKEEGVFYKEKTGRKGKGFKAVFSLDAENVIVHIRSNGFSFRLDNKIGRILPIWEDDPKRMDKKTHVKVELVSPQFSIKEIYPEFRRLFCIDDREEMFAHSPFLFMHRLKSVHVARIHENGEDKFITDYQASKTVYCHPLELNPEKTILGGIAEHGKYYREQCQEGAIITLTDDDIFEIPTVRYTRMIEDTEAYRNYSIMAPVIKSDTEINWRGGSLFRTFPMSLHPLTMPLAIDAPFILNPDRSGVQYSYKDEEGCDVPAEQWNTEVCERLFEKEGVFEECLLWLRTIDGVRMDKYIKAESFVLFSDQNNSDGHGNTWIPEVDISELCHTYPVFHLFAKLDVYVNFNEAFMVDKDLFNWPIVDQFFALVIGNDYEDQVLSDIYIGSPLFKAKSIEKDGFSEALNTYLDAVESVIAIDSPEMYAFVENQLYPYLKNNEKSILSADAEAFKKMRIYFSRLQEGNYVRIIRESAEENVQWFHSDDGTAYTSINRYRVLESSPVNIGIIKSIADRVLKSKKLYIRFGGKNLNTTAKNNCKTWDAMRDLLEASYHFGYKTDELQMPHLNKYVLSENFDKGFNAFRQTGVLEIIPDDDIDKLSRYFSGDKKRVAVELIKLGVKRGNEFFYVRGNYIAFLDDTLLVLQSEKCPNEILEAIKREKEKQGKDIDATYDSIKTCQEKVLLYFLDKSNALFSNDSYSNLCESIQGINKYWERNDPIAVEMLIRACAGATKTITNKGERTIHISLEEVLGKHLENCIEKIVSQNLLGCVSVEEGNSGFISIPEEEIWPLIKMLKFDLPDKNVRFYKGNFLRFGSKNSYLKDGKGGHIYLQCTENGDYKGALEECLNQNFDTKVLQYIDEMENQYRDVREKWIVPILNKTDYDLNRTYEEVEQCFNSCSKQEIISILSWFRYSGYANALGNGNINNEKEIEDDYRNDPWKFVYEFIQNVDDCNYSGRRPELSILVNKEENSISFEYNEDGFTLDDIKALTQFGNSNKMGTLDKNRDEEGLFDREKTGRKGRGFKSVFALPGKDIIVHICSNGFTFKFVKRLGTIIPIWEYVSEPPKCGSRIIVEGLTVDYTKKLLDKMQSVFGVDEIENFYSLCPVLYLRQLSRVSVNNGGNLFSIEIEPVNRKFSKDMYVTDGKPVAGIMHNGQLHAHMLEKLQISVTNGYETNIFDSIRFSMMFSTAGVCRVGSIFAPVMDAKSRISFKKGALYRTLPMDGHVLSIPLAINAPFETDSGRINVDDCKMNQSIIEFVFGELLQAFFENLRCVPNIYIEKYIPKASEELFNDYKNFGSVNLKDRIRDIPILHTYSGETFVSCYDAVVLPLECYNWNDPEKLSECFYKDSGILLDCHYVNKLECRKIELSSAKFVENINCYLNVIDTEDWINLLQQEIYPYLNQHFNKILTAYRINGSQEKLKEMCIFAFKMADGSIARECANTSAIWMQNVPTGHMSFGNYRNIEESSISGGTEKYEWLKELHKVVEFKNAFTGDKLSGNQIQSWEQTAELIETILYYDVKRQVRIPYLTNCALASEFDEQENLFRTAYLETENTGILKHVITHDELLEISHETGAYVKVSLTELVELIKTMRLRSSDDFFEDLQKGNYGLNANTVSLLENYCDCDERASVVVGAIGQAFSKIRMKKTAQLLVVYKDVEKCSNAVFAKIFEYEVLSGDTQSNLAEDFCVSRNVQNSVDFMEAYLRALSVIRKVPESKSICIEMNLSDIIERGLGKCAQDCKLANLDTDIFGLVLNVDTELEDYPSHEIEQALLWLDDERAVSASYEYYTADLAKAFGSVDDHYDCFLFDDEKVILNAGSAQNSLLKFVQKRYKGKDASFSALINIISEQNELKGPWIKSKKEYIEKLSKFRKDTWRQREILFPGYDEHLNHATGNAADCVLPELLQNINDCVVGRGQDTRTLNIEIDAEKRRMLLQYDEAGFDFANVYSITAIGQSSKHDESEGEKGLGFKKVFTVFNRVEIYSNDFSFSLTSENNTVPQWIDDKERQEQYQLDGKTTMLFTAADSKKEQLADMLEKLEDLINGEYVGNRISPLFLKNIDFIYLKGKKEYYSRREMEQKFIFTNVQLLPFYEKLLAVTQTDEEDVQEQIEKIREQLQGRKKCQLMNAGKRNQYIDSLTVEIAIPKRVGFAKGKGCFYSTLPTENLLHACLFINLPLELTTGRNDIMRDSAYNKAVLHMLFAPYANGQAMFRKLFEKIAVENRNIQFLDYIIPELKEFVQKICSVTGNQESAVNEVLEHTEILYSCELDGMVSLSNSYSVDQIICRYLNEVKTPENDVQTWMESRSEGSRKYYLTLPSTVADCDNLESFAKIIGTRVEYFPIQERDHDFAVEYLMDEYGYVGGIGFDE